MEAFDDRRLINLARYHLYSGKKEADDQTEILALIQKDKLTNGERNLLLEFIESNKYTKPMSMNDMKKEIFAIIGATPEQSNAYTNTCNRAELEVIYNYVKSVAGKQ